MSKIRNYPEGYTTIDGLRYQLQETDLFDDMLETGFQQTHNVSVNGGTKSLSYRMSAGMVKQDGVLVTDKDAYNRYNISSYIRSDIYSWITPELDIKYTNLNSSLPTSSAPYGIWGAASAFLLISHWVKWKWKMAQAFLLIRHVIKLF